MKPDCEDCGKMIQGSIKVHTYRKKVGQKSKNVVEYYCEDCYETIEEERSWDEYNAKKEAIKKQNLKRLQRKKNR
jgi:hypothetical protein